MIVSAAECRLDGRIKVLAGVRNRLRALVLPPCAYSTATATASKSFVDVSTRGKDRGEVAMRGDGDANDDNGHSGDRGGLIANTSSIDLGCHTARLTSSPLRTTVSLDDLVLDMSPLFAPRREGNRNSSVKCRNDVGLDTVHGNKWGHSNTASNSRNNRGIDRNVKMDEEVDKNENKKWEIKNVDGTYDISVLEATYEHISGSSGGITVSLTLRNISM